MLKEWYLDKVIGWFAVAFDEDRVNTWCHCMLHYALEDKLLRVLCCCSDGIIDVQDSISSVWCPDDYWYSGLVWYMVQYHKRYEISIISRDVFVKNVMILVGTI